VYKNVLIIILNNQSGSN